METFSQFITPGIILLLTLGFGFWLSLSGKPYNGLLFNIHKLIGLAAVVLMAIQIYQAFKTTQPQALIVILLILSVVCVLALFATGAMLSIGKLDYGLMLTIHRAAMVLLPIVLAATIYLMNGRKP